MRASGDDVQRMVGVTEPRDGYGVTQRSGHSRRIFLSCVPVKFCPVGLNVEIVLVAVWDQRVHYEALHGFLGKIVEYEVQGLKVSLSRGTLILGHDGHLDLYIDPPKLDGPPKNAN